MSLEAIRARDQANLARIREEDKAFLDIETKLPPPNFQQVLEHGKKMKVAAKKWETTDKTDENAQTMARSDYWQYDGWVGDLQSMAKGEEAHGVRNQYYPDWQDNDFKKLLEELGENF